MRNLYNKNTSEARPLYSVIMPVHNRQHCVFYAIESVLNQTCEDFEFIIIDDASTDKTPDILQFYAAKDSRIKLVRNDRNSRQGPIEQQWEPRNDGLKIAKGSLIAYLDSDNLWDLAFLGHLSEPFMDETTQLAHCHSWNLYRDAEEYLRILNGDKRKLLQADDANKAAIFSHDNAMIRQGRPGIDWFIDTNEMVHRRTVVRNLGTLWPTAHWNREAISTAEQVGDRGRRHNDLAVVERIIAEHGLEAIAQVDFPLVNFFYSNTQHEYALPLRFREDINRILRRTRQIHWQNHINAASV